MTNITISRIITALTIQCAWSIRAMMSRFAASADAAEPGILDGDRTMRANSRSNRSVLVGILCALAACGDVDGGAVELSWKLRPASSALEDKFVNCRSDEDGTGTVTAIRLDWTVD